MRLQPPFRSGGRRRGPGETGVRTCRASKTPTANAIVRTDGLAETVRPNAAPSAGEQSEAKQTRAPRNERSELPGRSVGSRGQVAGATMTRHAVPPIGGLADLVCFHRDSRGKSVYSDMASMRRGRSPGRAQHEMESRRLAKPQASQMGDRMGLRLGLCVCIQSIEYKPCSIDKDCTISRELIDPAAKAAMK